MSSLMPKILGLLSVGILKPSTVILRSSMYSFIKLENMVTVDLVRGISCHLHTDEARKIGEIAVCFRAHVNNSIV